MSVTTKNISQAGNAGYSGKPLARKLGLKPGFRLLCINAPANYERLLKPLPPDLELRSRASRYIDMAHLFVTKKQSLVRHLGNLRKRLEPATAVWVSWPKKASGVATDVTEDTIRQVALPLGFVDVKVCAVSDVWSALKLVVRKELR